MTNVKDRHVFISGPMTGIESYNVDAFLSAHKTLKMLGARYVFDPAIEWLDGSGPTREHAYYMLRAIGELTNSDGYGRPDYDVLVSLPGWENSEGARLERTVAEACGIETCNLSEVEGAS
ncbi:MAG: DUF4406 domain-containing protein [Atopobiaceae bacterium]|nr:DUF4406 domain-containing protein [Atopobiaceae bacterium]MBR3160138.1 DUF4406 domain-containing protein [Atopobiaceae bacterium]